MLLALQILVSLTGALVVLSVLFGALTEVARKSQNHRPISGREIIKTTVAAPRMIRRSAA